MELFDTHFHYYREVAPAEYYSKAAERGVKHMLATGGNYDESLACRDFAADIDAAWFTAGVHPHQASEYIGDISMFDEFRGEQKFVAVGEIGLDYFYENSEKKHQRDVFEKFLKLALEWKLPAVIHCRDKEGSEEAYDDTGALLKDFSADGGRFVVHCYTGTIERAEEFLEMGAYIGFTGIVTFPRAQNVRDVLKVVPDDKLLLETDTPYLAPVPYRGKTNHSCYLPEIAERVASEKGMTTEALAKMTTANAFKIFNL